jgi:hypothetical protein
VYLQPQIYQCTVGVVEALVGVQLCRHHKDDERQSTGERKSTKEKRESRNQRGKETQKGRNEMR